MWKGCATPTATSAGVFAALLAKEGVTGPNEAFEGRHGLWEQVTGPFQLQPMGGEDGRGFMIERSFLKYFVTEYHSQAPLWMALRLRERVPWTEIEQLNLQTYFMAYSELASEPAKWDPQTRETADHSLPYMLARTLVDGPVTTRSFTDDKVRDPSLRPLMKKIKVAVDDTLEAALPRMIMRVKVWTKDRREHEVEIADPLGHPDNPMRDRDIEAKFTAMVEPVLGSERCRTSLDSLWRIDESRDVGGLIALLDLQPRR
jgi:2-methylcitrate dehydratase